MGHSILPLTAPASFDSLRTCLAPPPRKSNPQGLKRDLAKSMFRMLIEKSKALLPESSAFFELLGFAILASGIFSGLALITYDPTDSIKLFAPGKLFATDETYENMVGPAGAWLADFLLSTFGLVSFLIASVLFFWGGMMALGFVRWPKTKRFVGFALIVVVACGLVHIDEPNPSGARLSNGFGGRSGTTFGNTLLNS